MRSLPSLAALVAATAATLGGCGKDNPAAIDAPPGTDIDAPPGTPIDAEPVPLPDAAQATCTPTAGTNIGTVEVLPAGMLTRPNLVTSPVGDRRLFVVEQPGRIRIIDQGALQATPFLDISSDMDGPVLSTGDEQGLLGLAFHPDFATNHKFYVHYTRDTDGDEVIAEYRTGTNGLGDPATARVLLTVNDTRNNHNGGMVEFSPVDGFLYIALGDGGSGNDPDNNGQRTSQLLGKILRIDVDTTTGSKPYGIPASNPFAASADGPDDPRPEVWAYGLRNPFRFSFDSNGDLFIGDVGQDAREEIDVQRVAEAPGQNYGWDDVEGNQCAEAGCSMDGKEAPVTTHPNDPWCAVMGGAVYRGSCFPDLVGDYFYSDYCVTEIWSLDAATAASDTKRTDEISGSITSIHPDALGELYITLLSGRILRIIAS